MKKLVEYIIYFFIFLSIGVLGLSSYRLFQTYKAYSEANTLYTDSSQEYTKEIVEDTSTSEKIDLSGIIVKKRPPKEVDFKSLKELNSDVCAWIYSPGTVIDYPVVQAKDNSYYLNRLVDKSWNANGTLFVDYRNNAFVDYNTVIYGHHMNDGSMLASIDKYRKQEYYDEHPVMYLLTDDTCYVLQIFSGFVTASDSLVYNFELKYYNEYKDWIAYLKSNSLFETKEEVEFTEFDKVVILSTCVYDFNNARFVLCCKLVDINNI